jgi:hypothetical protein
MRTRISAAALLFALLASGLTACAPAPADARANVSSEGFTVAVDGAIATAPGGVSSTGTSVELKAITAPVPAGVSSFATVAGTAVFLSLEGKQPDKPIELRFDVPEGTDPETVYVIGEDKSTGSGISFLESAWDRENSIIVATTEHLSWFAPVTVSGERFGDEMSSWIEQALDTETAAPSCAQNANLVFSPVKDDVVWPCAKESGNTVDWSLQSNSGLVWEVLTDPKADYEQLTSLSPAGIATIEASHLLRATLVGDSIVVPGETTEAHFNNGSTSYTLELKVAPGLSQVASIMFGLSMILPAKAMDQVETAECLVDVVKAATSKPSGETFRTILSCAGAAMKGSVGDLIGILLTGPALLANQLEGLTREITRSNVVHFTLSRPDPTKVDALPSGATWLYDLYAEKGLDDAGIGDPRQDTALVPDGNSEKTYLNSTNQWVGCNGDVASVIFRLEGLYSELSLGIGLQEHAPDGMTASFDLYSYEPVGMHESLTILDPTPIGHWDIERGQILERTVIPVDGLGGIGIVASTDDVCGTANEGYGALLDAWVR